MKERQGERRLPPPRPHTADPSRLWATDRADIVVGLDWIGRWIFEARRRAGLTQKQLERMSGVDQTTISRLERGRLAGLRLYRLAAIISCLVATGGLPLAGRR